MSMLRPIDDATFRPLLREQKRNCPYTPKGIHLFKTTYVCPENPELVGESVDVRYDEDNRASIEVYLGGEWVATAIDVARLTAEQRDTLWRARGVQRARILARHRAALKRARRPATPPDAERDGYPGPLPDLAAAQRQAEFTEARMRELLGTAGKSSEETVVDDGQRTRPSWAPRT